MSSATAPIGMFDSGIGGISVLRAVRALLPGESIIYVADSGYCPYGGRSATEIVARAETITDYLIERGARLIVVACNTATIAAVEWLRATYTLPFVGTEPGIKPAAQATRSGVVGVLATQATLAGERVHRLVSQHASTLRVITQPCPGLVELVEAGELDGPRTRTLLWQYVAPLLAAGADTLVLGCTHYPFLRPLLAELAGPAVTIIDTGAAVARRVASLLGQDGLPAALAAPAALEWRTSGDPASVQAAVARLWPDPGPVLALPPPQPSVV